MIRVWKQIGEAGGGEWNKTSSGLSWSKYYGQEETWSTWNNYIVFRYAEAYLLRAEALVETGENTNEAKELLKVIRDRAGNTNTIEMALSTFYPGHPLQIIRYARCVYLEHDGLLLLVIIRSNVVPAGMTNPV